MQIEYSSQDFAKKVIRRAKIYSKLYPVRNYTKISKLNYDGFINRLEQAKKDYPDHASFFTLIQTYAHQCKETYQEGVQTFQYKPEVLNFACYKALEKELKNGKAFDGLSDLFNSNISEVIKYYDGIDYALKILDDCANASKKEKELEM